METAGSAVAAGSERQVCPDRCTSGVPGSASEPYADSGNPSRTGERGTNVPGRTFVTVAECTPE
jgi:hypothetical protein